jgi:hypothetical protein
MADNAPITGAAVAATFDPAAWLSHFELIGGGWIVTDRLELFAGDPSLPNGRVVQIRQMINELSANNRNAILVHVVGHYPEINRWKPTPPSAGDPAGYTSEGTDEMNMMSRIQADIATGTEDENIMSSFQSARQHYSSACRVREGLRALDRDETYTDMAENVALASFWQMIKAPANSPYEIATKIELALIEFGETGDLRTDIVKTFLCDIRRLASRNAVA